jgi:cytochrome c oxidase subunit III
MSQTISHRRFVIHPLKFNMWLAIVAMTMMFAAFTSAYVVKKADLRTWAEIELPAMFTYSTVVILISSLFMQLSYYAYKKNNVALHRVFMLLTLTAGASFLFLQIQGWQQLTDSGINLSANVAGSFVYVISGAHFLHVVGGVIALLVFSIRAFTRIKQPVDTLVENIHPDRQVGVELMATYWHFVDVLWLYLFFFFQMS